MSTTGSLFSRLSDKSSYDVIVLGSGAAGMSAAIFAALGGRKTLLLEKTEYLGGTTAFSASTTWVPNTHHAATVGAKDSYENASLFLDNAVGNRSSKQLRDIFLKTGPQIIAELEAKTRLQFRPRPFHPDYLYELEGSTSCGRALEPRPYNAQELKDDMALVRPPIPEFTIFGGLMVDRDDIAHLLKIKQSPRSALYAARMFAKYAKDRALYGRDTRMVMGNAMIGRMLYSLRQLKVDIATEVTVEKLISQKNDGLAQITGLVAAQNGVRCEIEAKGGIILATGGFARHPEKRQRYLPTPVPEHSPSAPGHTGEMHDMVLALGAHYGDSAEENCFWTPVSTRKRADGTLATFPHFVFDRSKPGTVCVGRDGRRFVNESTSYHLFGAAMFAQNKKGNTIPAYIITDKAGLKKYGLGMVRPGGGPIKSFLKDGYLTQAASLTELAQKLEIDAGGLAQTIAQMNDYARTGIDTEFARGTTVYERGNGDAEYDGPNPTLGPIGEAPFYAVKLYPSDLGSAMGLMTNEHCQLITEEGRVLEGLYAAGNDMHSIMGGVYPGPGITIGPGIVFGAIAGKHASARASQ